MTYSFTEKKRIRNDFGKRSSILDVPSSLRRSSIRIAISLQRTCRRRSAGESAAGRVRVGVPDRELLRRCPASSSWSIGSRTPSST